MKFIAYLIMPLILIGLYGGCGNGNSDNINNKNQCFSVNSTNPCFDANEGGSKILVNDRTADEVVDLKRNETGFIGDLDKAHVIKSFNQSISDFECNAALSESEFVIKNSRDWNRFISSCFFSQFSIPQNIDFSNQNILVSIIDTGNGGTGTEILSILDFTSEIVVVIKDDETGEEVNFLRFIFHIISVPKIDNKPIDFIRVKENEVNTCFSKDSDNPCFNTDGNRAFITDKTIDQVINENISREDFVKNISNTLNREAGPFVGPPESFLDPRCVAAWGDFEGFIDNREDWDNFKLNCIVLDGSRLRNVRDIDFNKEMVLFSLQDKDGLGTTIDAILEFDKEIEVIIRDDISNSELPILVFPSNVVVVPRIELPINFIRVNNLSEINTIDGCTAEKAFEVIPSCLAEELVSGAFSDCECVGDNSGSFLMEFSFIVNGSARPILLFEGDFPPHVIESLDCESISLSLGSANVGIFEDLNVPGLGMLNFTKILEGVENVECNCIDSPCAVIPVTN